MPGTGVTTWKVGAPDRPLFASSKAIDRSQVFAPPATASGWDAIVDGNLSASDPDARQFVGIMEAIGYCDSVLGLSEAAIAVKPKNFGVSYSETSAAPYGDGSGLNSLYLVGLGAGTWARSGSDTLHLVEWTWGASGTALASISAVYIKDMLINSAQTGTKLFCSLSLILDNVHFRNTSSGAITIGDITTFSNGTIFIRNSKVTSANSSSPVSVGATDVYIWNSELRPLGTTRVLTAFSLITVDGSAVIFSDINAIGVTITDSVIGTCTLTSDFIHLDIKADSTTGTGANVTFSGGGSHQYFFVRGRFLNFTSTDGMSNNAQKHIDISCTTCDITGPAHVRISARGPTTGGNIVTLRGRCITGSIETAGFPTFSGSVGLNAVALTISSFTLVADGTSTTGTSKPYALDASCANNVIVYQATGWPNAGTNLGGATNVFVPTDVALASALNDHLVDPTDAHDASAVSFAPTGTIVATDVQAMGAELDGDIQAHIADATAAHAASAISYAGSAGLSASDVEAAIDELDTEKLSSVINDPIYRTRAW